VKPVAVVFRTPNLWIISDLGSASRGNVMPSRVEKSFRIA
jgi:hypothetical protein